jgi:hypothetical protein
MNFAAMKNLQKRQLRKHWKEKVIYLTKGCQMKVAEAKWCSCPSMRK